MTRLICMSVYLSLLYSVIVSPQTRYIDSLEKFYSTANCDSVKLGFLTKICSEYINTDTAKARKYFELMIKEAGRSKSTYDKAEAYRTAGNYFRILAEYNRSLEYFRSALSLYKTINNTKGRIGYGKALTDFGSVFHFNGDFRTALTIYLEADSILTNSNDYATLLNLYSLISDVYMKLNRIDESTSYVNKINSIIVNVTDQSVKCRYYISHANMLVYQKKYLEANGFYNLAKKIAEPAKKYNILTSWAYNYGFMLSRQKKYDEALIYYTKSIEYARLFGSKYDECDALYKIGLMHYYSHRYKKANTVLIKALGFAREINSKLLVRNILDALTYLEADMGNYKLAYNYLQSVFDISNELFTESDQRSVDFLKAKYESEKSVAQIHHLLNEEKIESLQIQRREILIYVFSALLVFTLVAGFLFIRYYKSKRKIAEQLDQIKGQKIKQLEKEKQLASVQYALQGEEKERSRLARDLHDGLGGLLSGTKIALNSYKQNLVTDRDQIDLLKHPLDLLNKSIKELQRIAHNMMPHALVSGSLKDALSEFCMKMNDNDLLKIKFGFFGTEEKLEQNYQLAVYRIVQELINNVLKHSNATEVLVQLVQENNRISVTVHDNGKGFNMETLQMTEGHGFNNIRLRVDSLGGHFFIDSRVGSGTDVSIEFENLN